MTPPGFTGATLDRADRLRHDAAAYAEVMADPRARLLALNGYEPEADGQQLAWRSLATVRDDAELLLLGLDEAGVPHFAAINPDEKPGQRSMALFGLLASLRGDQAALYAGARSVIDWHSRHRFCAVCGTASKVFRAGWARKCPNCAAEHFPRVDPVVIMLAEHQGRVLVGRQAGFPPRRYSALAGFVEAGESIEEAVARETLEEAGVRVRDVRYVASQPWPFPSNLMIACIAEAESDTLSIDTNELEDAFWVSRDAVCAALADDPSAPFLPPPRYAIAHSLLTHWVEQQV